MTPEQMQGLKVAAQKLVDARNAPLHIFNARRDEYHDHAPAFALLSLIAQVEALTVPQWVDTRKQLPAEQQRVFICTVQGYKNAPTTYNVSIAYYMDTDFWQGDYILNTPSHWMAIDYPAAPTIPAIPGTKEGA